MTHISNKRIMFTKQQQLILYYLSKGFTARAIAIETGISINTVNYHKKNIFLLLDVNSSTEAVAKAIKMELLINNLT
jgi:DNA-binding NarL/FixJ family response regulator